jgi:hypothetical protein
MDNQHAAQGRLPNHSRFDVAYASMWLTTRRKRSGRAALSVFGLLSVYLTSCQELECPGYFESGIDGASGGKTICFSEALSGK